MSMASFSMKICQMIWTLLEMAIDYMNFMKAMHFMLIVN